MPFLLLLCLIVACLPLPWPAPPLDFGVTESALATATLVLLYLTLTVLLAHRTILRLNRFPSKREATLERYGAWRILHFFGALGVFGVCLACLGWGWSVKQLATISTNDGVGTLAPGAEFLTLLPFFMMQAGSWFLFYDVSQAIHATGPDARQRFWTRGGYVLFHFRQNLLIPYAPLILMLVSQGLFRAYPELEHSDWVKYGSPLMLPLFLILIPLALKPLLGLRPIANGPLRQRLEAHARRLGVRARDFLLWDTRRGIATAMVVGIIPRARYVIFTDRLLSDLKDDEVDAVLGHELGHVRHGHMLFYALFLILSLTLMKAVYDVVRMTGWLPEREYYELALVAPVFFIGSYMFVVFGFLSRRCERQADLFGCRAGSCFDPACHGHDDKTVLAPGGHGLCPTGIKAFVRALERVEVVNDMTRDKIAWRGATLRERLGMTFRFLTGWLSTWQHSTIAKRVAFLHRVAADLNVEMRFQRRVFRVKWAIVLTLIGALITMGAIWGWEILTPGG